MRLCCKRPTGLRRLSRRPSISRTLLALALPLLLPTSNNILTSTSIRYHKGPRNIRHSANLRTSVHAMSEARWPHNVRHQARLEPHIAAPSRPRPRSPSAVVRHTPSPPSLPRIRPRCESRALLFYTAPDLCLTCAIFLSKPHRGTFPRKATPPQPETRHH